MFKVSPAQCASGETVNYLSFSGNIGQRILPSMVPSFAVTKSERAEDQSVHPGFWNMSSPDTEGSFAN